ncbi:terpene synthase family protein [Streptomyces wuyuanensis]|uniref:terpene synthase family protein n=1 Tax=Streptomyces wuyuanensis TaxID=1196353 RepID=UPI0034323280
MGHDPITGAVADIALRLHGFLTPTQLGRCVETVRRWFTGAMWEKALAHTGGQLTLNEYTALRMDSGAGAAWFALCEIGRAGGEVPAAKMDAPAVRALREMCWVIVGWDNYIFSHAKERWLAAHSSLPVDDAPNLVTLLAEQEGLGLSDALGEAVALRNRVMSAFIRLRAQVLPGAGEPLRAFFTESGT